MKARCLIFLSLLFSFMISSGYETEDIERLDRAIARRDDFMKDKKLRIDSLRRLADSLYDPQAKLDVYNKLYLEYLTFSFDSVMTYINKAEELSLKINTYGSSAQVQIHRALALATSGHFSHAVEILEHIDSAKLPESIKEEYFAACEWTFGVWAEYSDKSSIAPEFKAKSLVYLDSLIETSTPGTPEFDYRKAEKALRTKNYKVAEKLYLATLRQIPVGSRLYAQAAYALALVYRELGDAANYRHWLINAAISDQTVPLKENLALQQLALFLKTDENDLKRANDYLKLALDDAVFYNNRLRMLEIAAKIPEIANVYQDTVSSQNMRLKIYLLAIGILMSALAAVLVFAFIQKRKVARAKDTLAEMNLSLQNLNSKLANTNRSREQYVGLFIDLCVTYIDKLNRFPIFLKLKVKNMSDLNSVAERYVRPSEAETREMFVNFDNAFLRLYPDFIPAFNSLLRPDAPILPKKGELLNTDLRIYALVRMGITDSNKIASMLFLSPQTIFNHRSQVRNRALDRNSFEARIADLCATIPEPEHT